VLVGRDDEQARIEELVQQAGEGLSGALVVSGEAGMGKTSLLGVATEGTSMRVMEVAGLETERDLCYATLHRLFLSMLDQIERLPVPQRDALQAVFGLIDDDAPDRYLVGLAALTLLSDAAVDRRLLCVVDDTQWIDVDSANVLGFVARRLHADGIAMLFAVREPSDRSSALEGLDRLELAGLSDGDARDLLAQCVADELDAAVADRLVRESGGNPLALLELGRALTAGQLSGRDHLPAALPLGHHLERIYLDQIGALPPATQMLLLLIAAEPTGNARYVWDAASSLGIDGEAVEPALAADLLRTGPTIEYRHPLIRSAVYRGATAEDRQRAHLALAAATVEAQDVDRRAWHRAEAADGPDEDVAAELARSAARARRRGGYAAEAAFYIRAADLSPNDATRARRRLAAAQASLASGDPSVAEELVEAAEPHLVLPLDRANGQRLRGNVRALVGDYATAPSLLLQAAEQLVDLDPRLGRDAFLEALEASIVARHLATTATMHDVAATAVRAPRATTVASPVTDSLLDGFSTLISVGYADALPHLRRSVSAIISATADDAMTRWAILASHAAQIVFDDIGFREVLDHVARMSRERAQLHALRIALLALATTETWAGRFGAAEAFHDEAARITEAMVGAAGGYGFMHLELRAWQGRDETRSLAEALAGRSAAMGVGANVHSAELALTILEIGRGEFESALRRTRTMYAQDPMIRANLVLPELVEAAVRCGDRETATSALRQFEARADAAGTDWALGLLARGRALVAVRADAEADFLTALERLERTRLRTEVARTHLLYGEWLAEARRTVEARDQLQIAHSSFEAMGSAAFATRALDGLESVGVDVGARRPVAGGALTNQEHQIAKLAADGATNREIASQLFLSASTVDYHLRKVFKKLGITSRRQLGDQTFDEG
jgi:DNA-binding CsgD family transcriptional regulator